MVLLPYDTKEIFFKGVGSPLDDVPINIKPYLNKLKKDWFEIQVPRLKELLGCYYFEL